MEKKLVIPFTLLTLMFSAGCSRKSLESPSRDSRILKAGSQGATFVVRCQPTRFALLNQDVYIQSRYTFMPEVAEGSGIPMYSEQIEMYSEEDCRDENHMATIIGNGAYGLRKNGALADVEFQNFLFIPQRDALTAQLNERSYCGIKDWSTGTGKELSREGGCWETSRRVSYQLVAKDPQSRQIQINGCEESDSAMIPQVSCAKFKATRVE